MVKTYPPPSVSLVSPANGSRVSGNFQVSGSASSVLGISSVQLIIDGKLEAIDTSAPYNFYVNSKQLTNGSHSLYLVAYDTSGNHTSSNSIDLIVDNTVDNSSAPGSTGSPTVSAQVNSSSQAQGVNIKIDGQPVTGDSVNTAYLTNGIHTIAVLDNGKIKYERINVHNPPLIALRNLFLAHPVAYTSAISGMFIIGLCLVLWKFKTSVFNLLIKIQYKIYKFLSRA